MNRLPAKTTVCVPVFHSARKPFTAASMPACPGLARHGVRAYASRTSTGTGLRRMSSTGLVFCTYSHSPTTSSREASVSGW